MIFYLLGENTGIMTRVAPIPNFKLKNEEFIGYFPQSDTNKI